MRSATSIWRRFAAVPAALWSSIMIGARRFVVTWRYCGRSIHCGAPMTKVAVTGSRGFIGSVLCRTLRANGHDVIPIGRELLDAAHRPGGRGALESAMAGAGVVIHLAARAHVMTEKHADPLAEYRRVNLAGT